MGISKSGTVSGSRNSRSRANSKMESSLLSSSKVQNARFESSNVKTLKKKKELEIVLRNNEDSMGIISSGNESKRVYFVQPVCNNPTSFSVPCLNSSGCFYCWINFYKKCLAQDRGHIDLSCRSWKSGICCGGLWLNGAVCYRGQASLLSRCPCSTSHGTLQFVLLSFVFPFLIMITASFHTNVGRGFDIPMRGALTTGDEWRFVHFESNHKKIAISAPFSIESASDIEAWTRVTGNVVPHPFEKSDKAYFRNLLCIDCGSMARGCFFIQIQLARKL
jgi:hypothetical protein